MTSESCLFCISERGRAKYQLTIYRIAECTDCTLAYHDHFRGAGIAMRCSPEDSYPNVQHEAFSK
jgi:hypothetical protein